MNILKELEQLLYQRKKEMPKGSYTAKLFAGTDKKAAVDKLLEKIGEETVESIIAVKNKNKEEVIYEIGDLMYHLLALLVYLEIPLEDILNELRRRRK